MACDASPFGVGAILLQILADGLEHPIAYASISFTEPCVEKIFTIGQGGIGNHFRCY